MDISTARHLAELLAENGGPPGHTWDAASDCPRGFELFQLIGEGASGRVWLAKREGGEQLVALKVMKKPLGEGKNAQRAWRELDLLNQIRSRRIPAVLDHGTHRGRLFIATEFIDGLPIDEYAESTTLDRRGRVELLAKVCEAAGELHNSGIIHRDIKPSNILVTSDGEPVIIDLGIASLLSTDVMQTLTDDGSPIGTPAYMSPEQARGERRNVGVRSDVWSLGAVCCRMLTGGTPHDLGGCSLYEAVRRAGTLPCRDPSALDPLLPKPLTAVVSKACALKPSDRYASATELAADLRRWLDRQPVEAQPPGPWLRAMRWTTRHPVLTTAGLCAAMLGGTGAATWWVSYTLNWKPIDVAVNSAHTEAWLESRTHNPVATLLRAPDTKGSISAARIDRPEALGGGWLALVSGTDEVSRKEHLFCYDPHRPGRPVWRAPAPGPFPPLGYPSYDTVAARAQHTYGAAQFLTADIFPDHPGEEIALFSRGSPDFPSCLRVYGTDSFRELYRVWVPGHATMHWIEQDGLFVLAGPIHRLFTPAWTESDAKAGVDPPMYPVCITLLRPEQGRLDNRWLTYKVPGSTTNADACWVLVQPVTHERGAWEADHSLCGFDLHVGPTSRGNNRRSTFTIEFRGWRNETSLTATGTLITNTRLEEIGPLEPDNALQADAGFAELIGMFGTPRLRFEDAPAFDPNAR